VADDSVQWNQPLLLRPGRLKWLAVAAVSLAFVAESVHLMRSGAWIAWPGTVFFGFGLLVSLAQLLPGASYLRLTQEGFTIRSLFRTDTIRWADVTGFRSGRILLTKMVLFDFEGSYEGSYARSRTLRALNLKLFGAGTGLPDSYGMKHEDLAVLLNRYKAASEPA
jgi:hypothetical protein